MSKNLEQISLGACLLDKEALSQTYENLSIEDFSFLNHKKIFQAIKNMVKENIVVDLATLAEKLQSGGILETVGGITYLTQLINSVPNIQNIEHYNSLLKKASNQEKVKAVLQNLKTGKIEIPEALQIISEIPIVEIKEENLKTLLKNTLIDSSQGVKYRFKIGALNQYLGGVDKGELITIGGFTSQGKTTCAIQLARDFMDRYEGTKVLYLTSEMTPIETSRRILSNLMPKNIMDFRKGVFEKEELKSLNEIAEIVGDHWNLNIKKVFDISDIRKYVYKYKPDILFIDYLQNLDRRGARSDYERVTGNIRDLQSLTLSNEITTFALSQLSRDKTEIREPRITDLRDSGRIEECSNIVLLVYWESRLKLGNEIRKGGETPERLEMNIVKNRDGCIGRLALDFEPEYCRVSESVWKGYDQE
ncbi:hypothetical protein CVT91_00085 [Candidatus Atribacteria bacterium HGW-Atribacteria-1]|nr:MAG: hypothetical protein CVT91_00085 [Candidatus Atribacteria bacterium HGW-Atribacteria-1]